MKAGQTFALAGLVQERTEVQKRGLPYVCDMPIVGVPFRKTEDVTNEIELLILVTPEFVDPIDPCEAPCGGPGTYTTSPNNRGLYCGGYMEVPTACNPTNGLGSCGQDPCGHCNNGCQCNGAPAMTRITDQGIPANTMMPTPAMQMPGGSGYDDSENAINVLPTPDSDQGAKPATPLEATPASPAPQDLSLPGGAQKSATETKPAARSPVPPQPSAPATPLPKPAQTPPATPAPAPKPDSGSYYPSPQPSDDTLPTSGSARSSPNTAPRSYSPQRQPVFVRNASRPNNPQSQQSQQAAPARESNLIGPIGYEQ
jgi:pilus assembly protein CpaC